MERAQLEARLSSIPSAAGRVWALIQWARQLSDDTIDAMGGQAVVAATVAVMYDTYIKPLDNPFVPNLIEPAVDEAIKQAILALIWAVDDES